MILVLAGTSEGRETASSLVQAGFKVLATTVSEYGAQLLRESGVEDVLVGPLEQERFSQLLDKNITGVVDATHPYAVNITRMALEICGKKVLPYIRLERPASEIPQDPLVIKARDLEEALDKALAKGGVLFSTLGSRNLARVVQRAQREGVRVIARVLPDPEVLKQCRDMGLKPDQIVALKGPFSRTLNRELFRAYEATAVITKESGGSGGVDTKISAALDLGIPIIIWMRPRLEYPRLVETPEEAVEEVKRIMQRRHTHERRNTPFGPRKPQGRGQPGNKRYLPVS